MTPRVDRPSVTDRSAIKAIRFVIEPGTFSKTRLNGAPYRYGITYRRRLRQS